MAHLFADISSHGFGHLAQAAPVLNALHAARPDLRLTVRSGLPRNRLALRIDGDFEHIHAASDFGFVMDNALDIDLPASAQRYREFHADWPDRVAAEAVFLSRLAPDLVLTDVAYLPLAGATAAGIPSASMCSLNWADLTHHYFHREDWLPGLHGQILAAYRSARVFLRTTPGMPMLDLPNVVNIGPVATPATMDRAEVARRLRLPKARRWVLVALGGFDFPLPVDQWPRPPGIRWLSPHQALARNLGFFNDLLAAADAVITKPGYGTFVEAATHGVPVLYLRRPDWPEQEHLIDWLRVHARSAEIGREQAQRGELLPTLEALWALPAPRRPQPTGIAQAAKALLDLLPC
jgi:hypothetical protein